MNKLVYSSSLDSAVAGRCRAVRVGETAICHAPRRVVVPALPQFVIEEEDPIFTAIEQHRAAMAAFSEAVDTLAVLLPGHELDAANAIAARKAEELDNAGVDLVTVQPTTFAGLIALLSHIVECSRLEKCEDWRLPGMLLFDARTGTLRRAEFLEPRAEEFAYFAMLAVTNTITRLVAARQCHDNPCRGPGPPARRAPFPLCGEARA